MAQRRGKGDGSLTQRHDHISCPPLENGSRPDHHCRGRWVATVDLGHIAGKRVRKTFYGKTRREAQLKLNKALRDRDNHSLTAGPGMTVETWLTYWLDVICIERGLKVNTLKSHRSKVTQYLIPHLGRHRLDRLEPEHVRAMYATLRTQGLAPATIRQIHAILRRALTVAQREGKVSRNVATLLDPPKVAKSKRTGLTLNDARRILAGDNLRAHLAISGLRQGEALALHWPDVDLDAGYLVVTQNLVRQPGVGLIYDTPKSATSIRAVPLEGRTLALMKLAWHDRLDDDALVFHNDNGGPIDHRVDWQRWKDYLAELGIPYVPLHAARNTFASGLEELGVSDRMVAEMMGHSQVQTTHGYQTANLEQHRAAMKALHGSK